MCSSDLVRTMDPARPEAEALLARDGRIVAVGSSAEVERARRDPDGVCVDLGGRVVIPGFVDAGPREPTHLAGNVVPFRLDRCLLHGLACRSATTLDFRPSDHKPIVLELIAAEARKHGPLRRLARRRMAQLKRAVAGNLRKMSGN